MKIIILLIALLAIATADAADITITIPDAQVPRVLNAIAETKGYTGYLVAPVTANPNATPPIAGNPGITETKAQFARRMLILWIIQQVKEAEGQVATKTAIDGVNTSVDAIGVN